MLSTSIRQVGSTFVSSLTAWSAPDVRALSRSLMRPGMLLCVLLFATAALTAPLSWGRDLVMSRTLLVDPTGKLTIGDVAASEGTPIDHQVAIGSTTSVLWMHLRIARPDGGNKVVILVRPPYLNEVRLYEAGPGAPSTWKSRVTGNGFPFAQRDRASLSLSFAVEVPASGGSYYLRLHTRSPAGFSAEAVTPQEADQRDHWRNLLIVFFGTAMLGLLLWAVHTYLLDRHPVIGLFAIHQSAYLLFGLVAAGYLAPFAPRGFPQLIDWINFVSYCVVTFTLLLFCRELFKLYDPPRLVRRGFGALLLVFPVQLATIALGYDTVAVNINTVLVKIIFIYLAAASFFLRAGSAPSRGFLRAFFSLVLSVNVAFWLAQLGSRAESGATIGAIQTLIFDGLVMGALFAAILRAFERRQRQQAHQATMDLVVVQKQLEMEQKLKRQAELQAQTDYLTGLFNRRHFVELVESELQRAIRYRRPLTLLMIDIDHFKAVNDAWGHATGDVVLQKVAQLICGELRSIDIVARMGGEEFAAMLVETEGEDAVQTAERLCKAVAGAAIPVSDIDEIHITVSIGVSQRKGRPADFDRMLDEADRAMYQVKQAGRNGFAVSASVAKQARPGGPER